MANTVEALRKSLANYMPSEEVCAELATVTMVPIVGPLAVGKSTCMEMVRALDNDFGRVQSFTTRDRREGEAEDEYRWRGHTQEAVDAIAEEVREGQLVQCVVHPTTGVVYGSDLSDFSHSYTMLDTLSTAVPALRALPFRKMVEMTLVSSPFMWDIGVAARSAQVSEDELEKRIKEGVQSLEWSLEQGGGMAWIKNAFDAPRQTAEEIIGVARGLREPNPANRQAGELLLAHIKEVLGG
ncbi:MAG TPA: hypothetical protein VHB72_04785 [Candidatus Saccharimonadales bacterium]|nr:hypothetical protein [Candidatus Saccharimonadales bacterium]